MTKWYLSEKENYLVRPEKVVQLTPKATAVLTCLKRHENEIVSVDTFLKEVWPNTHVTQDLVREYIHDLRVALQDDHNSPKFIETVRGKGFRLIGSIADLEPGAASLPETKQNKGYPTVAIIAPIFEGAGNLHGLADEFVREITTILSQFHYVEVFSHHMGHFKSDQSNIQDFARTVHAKYLFESRFLGIDQTIRARFLLVDSESGQHIWAKRIDFSEPTPLAEIDRICHIVVNALTGWHGELHRAEFKKLARNPKDKMNAFEHFISACNLEMKLDKGNLSRALFHLEKSTELDPAFARAWLVYALMLRWSYSIMPGRDKTFLTRSNRALLKAFNLAPTDPVNLALNATFAARIGNLRKALTQLHQAEEFMAGDSDAMVCVAFAKSILTDECNEACQILDRVYHLTAAAPSWFHFVEACVAFMASEHERCIASSITGPREVSSLAFRCLSHVSIGQENEAKQSYSLLSKTIPHFDFERFARSFPVANQTRRQEFDLAVTKLKKLLH